MKIYIQNMVSMRCKTVVKDILDKSGFHCKSVELGEAEIEEPFLTPDLRERLKEALVNSDFVLIEDKKSILIGRVIKVIIEMIHNTDELPREKCSVYISNKLKHDYNYLSNLFSEVKGTTIDQFVIRHKIEKVKELLANDELSLKEISYKLKYSSIAHLSNQFKKVTGQTPSYFKKQNIKVSTTL